MFWLSFADGNLPKGTQFLGACIVCADTFLDAVSKAHRLGINPGGEVIGHKIPSDREFLIRPEEVEVLMNRAQCEAQDRRMSQELAS